MKSVYTIIIILFIILLLLFSLKEVNQDPFDSNIYRKIAIAMKDSSEAEKDKSNSDSYIQELENDHKLTENQIQEYIKNSSNKDNYDRVSFWMFKKDDPVSASAFGTDYLHHFVNHYLIGYKPFDADQLWIPHYTISMKLKYQLDADQYGGLKDVWQNSKQAFFNTRGDCEDHAIVLADWLIECGADARVVMGTYKDGGHAWVVVFKDANVYLLEATSKHKRKHWRHYPLASFETNYHPKCMFNRDYFWINTGSVYTTRYSGKHWAKKSKFVRINKITS